MPKLAKRHMTQFVRRSCHRRLRFDLYSGTPGEEVLVGPDGVLTDNSPPKRETTRPGLPLLAEAGRKSEQERYEELELIFPRHTSRPVDGMPHVRTMAGDSTRYYMLDDVWDHLLVWPRFLIETEFQVPGAFRAALDLDAIVTAATSNRPKPQTLNLGNARPDIIQALPPATLGAENDPAKPVCEIRASGDVHPVSTDDRRIGLRVIDCKLAAEASEAHFAEIAYYCMTLAAWLDERCDKEGVPLSRRLLVRADSAVWPGRHAGSTMATLRMEKQKQHEEPTDEENLGAFEKDLDYLPTAVFTARVRRFFQKDLPAALEKADWREVDYHVDTRCVGCEYLGHHWGRRHEDDPEGTDPVYGDEAKGEAAENVVTDADPKDGSDRLSYCKPRARMEGHLSRLPGMTSGARRSLAKENVRSVADLAAKGMRDSVFDTHSALKAMRQVAGERARILGSRAATLVENAGATAILPRWADIKIFIVVEFDPASGLTGAFGHYIDYYRAPGKPAERTNVHIVRGKSVEAERDALLNFLTAVHAALLAAQARPWIWQNGAPKKPTAQTYFWDVIGYKHLRRVIGRHLAALVGTPLRDLAWLFPPEQVIPNPSSISLSSPVSIVAEAFRSLTAVDAPHFYSLLDCARYYHPDWLDKYGRKGEFLVPVMYRDPLTDYVPVERVHELWQDDGEVARRNLARLDRARRTGTKYRPLPEPATVARMLEDTLRIKLTALPAVTRPLTKSA